MRPDYRPAFWRDAGRVPRFPFFYEQKTDPNDSEGNIFSANITRLRVLSGRKILPLIPAHDLPLSEDVAFHRFEKVILSGAGLKVEHRIERV